RFEVRAQGDPAALLKPILAELKAVDPLLGDTSVDPLSSLMRDSISSARVLARLATGFGVLALLLAAIGLYGVMSYAIVRRTGEIGVRMALGAQRETVIRMVLRDAMRVVLLGVIIGVPLALASTRLLRSQLQNVGPTDPVALGIALAVLVASAVIAALL